MNRPTMITEEVPEHSTLYETYATFILQAHNMIELIDEMAGTNMYKQDLKQALNRLLRILDTPEYYSKINSTTADWEAFANLTEHHKRLFKRLVKLPPSSWGILAEAVFRLQDNTPLECRHAEHQCRGIGQY